MSAAVGNTLNPLVAHAMASMLRRRTDEMTNNLFDRMDANGTGAIDKAEMLKTFGTLEGASPEKDQKTVDDAFKVFDADEDGQITKDEMKSGLLRIADALDEQYNQARMSAAASAKLDLIPKVPDSQQAEDASQKKLQAYLEPEPATGTIATTA